MVHKSVTAGAASPKTTDFGGSFPSGRARVFRLRKTFPVTGNIPCYLPGCKCFLPATGKVLPQYRRVKVCTWKGIFRGVDRTQKANPNPTVTLSDVKLWIYITRCMSPIEATRSHKLPPPENRMINSKRRFSFAAENNFE